MQKRRLSRVNSGLKAVVQWGGHKMDGVVRDLSFNGLFIETEEDIPAHQEVVISIAFESQAATLGLVVPAKALRRDYDGMAFQFGSIELDSFSTLKQLILYNSDDPTKVDREFRAFISENANNLRTIK
ncbi:PilZ domain-containing protein [bacterium]|nr:PilZ domain-containing protein [bacterium]